MDKNKSCYLKSALWIALIFCLFAVGFVYWINNRVIVSTKPSMISSEAASQLDADCILVLGAGVWGNRPSYMLEDRLLQGVDLYRIGASDRFLMSGDHGTREYDEVNVMKQFAMDKGIPGEHIFMDHAGFDTYNSLYRAKDVFQVKRVIIVTQGYHLYRALYIADALGLEAQGVASDPRLYAGQELREIREVIARVKDFFKVIAKPKPVYLGEPIPISGNGNITND